MIKLYFRSLKMLGNERPLAALLLLTNLAVAVAQFAEPVLFGWIVDALTKMPQSEATFSWQGLLPLLGAWAGFGLFIILAGVVVALHADRMAHRRRLAVMADYFTHVLHLPAAFHTKNHSGRLIKVMLEGAGALAALWLSFFRENAAAFVMLFVMLPFSLFLNWRLGLVLIVLMLVFAVLTLTVLRKTETLQSAVEDYHSDLTARASDALGNIPVIQSFTRIGAEVEAMHSLIDRLLRAQLPVLSWWALAAVGTRAAATLSVLTIFITGAWLYSKGQTTLGEIVTFTSFATQLIGRLEQVVGFTNFLFLQSPKLADLYDIMDTEPQVSDSAVAQDVGRLQGRIRFEDVNFGYTSARQALKAISLDIAPGETVAFVGATGSGKSTLLGLLYRAYDPQTGCITIDGIDLRDMTLESLRRNIGVVFQEPMLFARSIEDNLRIGKPDATKEDIENALARAQALEVVSRQPEQMASLVGERGRNLSGGERQRLSIARTLLKEPPILILDEATSALDAATEQRLQAALDEVTKNRTTLIIAHRLATIKHAHKIVLMDQGAILEVGSFEELLHLGGKFAQLVKAQDLKSAGISESS